MPDWLLTVTTSTPAAFSWRTASPAPGSNRAFPGSWRKPGSSRMVPSRSRNAARRPGSAIERGADDPDGSRNLVGEDGARVEHDTVRCDAGDEGGSPARSPADNASAV